MAKVISKETMTIGIVAVLAGLLVAWGVESFLAQKEETPPPPKPAPRQLQVPLASQNLPMDHVVAMTDTYVLPMTCAQFDERFKGVDPEQVLMNRGGIVNRRLKEPIQRGQPFLTSKFWLSGTSPSVANMLQPGFRAIRVQVPDTREAGVQPGMFVDVLFRANARAAKAGQPPIPEKTLTLMRHIQVLETEHPGGAKAKGKANKPILVTLAVPEKKADMFSIIEGRGELWLVPTPSKETAEGAQAEVANVETLAELLGLRSPQKPPPPFETAIYRRGRVQINKFVDGKLVSGHVTERSRRNWEQSGPPVPADLPAVPGARAPAGPEMEAPATSSPEEEE